MSGPRLVLGEDLLCEPIVDNNGQLDSEVRELRPSWAWSCVAPVDDAGEAPVVPYEIARMEVAMVEGPGLGCHRGQESIQTGCDAFDRRVCQVALGRDGGEVECVYSMGSAQRVRYRFER